ncbi:immunoglobulin superfamily member 8-like [Sinocyclocheilus grahami]|uniref:immunoglobulin superfamily member 8-like n=1 Tax=Sinocyclocheilus grahami TaxID=75366 RepID=UPI0007AD4860|nr:PREDICTED: immunoglobulin superfamily member 8-like [Sinocyclocheilus grahami]
MEVRVSASVGLPRRPLLKRGSTVALLCNISVQTTRASRVEVQWLQEQASKDAALSEDSRGRVLATLSYDGLTLIYSNGSSLSVDRVSAGCFRLRIFSAAEEDQGHYQCRAEVWAQDPRGGWYNTGAKAESETVHLYLYARVTDLLLVPLAIGVSSALFVGVLIIATVTCCFMNTLARQRSRIRK